MSETVRPGLYPSIARVYDYALDGKDNYAVDREVADLVADALPPGANLAGECRDLVRRAVTWLVTEAGVDQIVDIGSGLPARPNVHEIAQHHRPGARTVYVDNDPAVLTHIRALLAAPGQTEAVPGDVRNPAAIFAHPGTRSLIDPAAPLAVLLTCVLHHLDDSDDPAGVVARLAASLPSGTYVLVANYVDDGTEPRVPGVEEAYRAGGLNSRFRPVTDHQRYFRGLELVDPGLVFANDWHPDVTSSRDSLTRRLYLAGLARTPFRPV